MKFKKTTVIALALAVIVVALGAGAFVMRSKTADYKDILQGDAEFLYVSGETAEPKTISDIPNLFDPDDDYMKIWDFAVQDLDGDGSAEVILSVQGISGDTGGNLILRQIGDKIYGYRIGNQDFFGLKTDGRFEYTKPAAFLETGIAAIHEFTETGYTVDKITYIRLDISSRIDIDRTAFSTGEGPCVIEHQPADEDEFNAAIKAHNEKPDAVWYAFTEENIKLIFE